jgi:hypothetical protein
LQRREITVDNQILFCEACNVAVHQKCYGIDAVPDGDYFCKACRFFQRDKKEDNKHNNNTAPLPISCELCPRKQGAFVRTQTEVSFFASKRRKHRKKSPSSPPPHPNWVHVVCAKWQGQNYIDRPRFEMIENVAAVKLHFRTMNMTCVLCNSSRGAFNPCRHTECNNYVHVTCARSSGLCVVVHGDNHEGDIEENPWTLLCPEHSGIAAPPEGSTTLEQLRIAAEAIIYEIIFGWYY